MITLVNAINSTQINIVVSDTYGLPLYPGYCIKIDNEPLIIKAISGRYLTVARGSSPASHLAGANVLLLDTSSLPTTYNPNASIPVPAAGMVKSDGTVLVAATPGVDYSIPVTGSSLTGIRQLFYRFFSLALNTPATVGSDLTNHITLFRDSVLKTARISAKTAPVGSALIIDILANGSTIWSTPSNRLSLASGTTSNSTTTFNTSSLSVGTVLTISIAQVGSSVAGQDIQVELEFEMSYP